MSGRPWTEAEVATVREHAGKLRDDEIARLVNRTTVAVRERRNRMFSTGTYPRDWSKAEIALIRERYATTTVPELLKLLPGRTNAALLSRARVEGLRRYKARISSGSFWTQEEDDQMRALYPDHEVASIMKALPNRSRQSIERRAAKLGLVHSEKFWETHYSTKIGVNGYPPELHDVVRLHRQLKKAIHEQQPHDQ